VGKRGPKPTPLAVLRARGSWRGAGKQARSEPLPPDGGASCPRWLPKLARKAWHRIAPILESMKVLTVADQEAFARYCVTLARWREAEEFLAKHGDTYPVKIDGEVVGFKNYPQVRVADRLATQLGRMEQSFGLTPSARARIEVPNGEEKKQEGTIKFFDGRKSAGA
jgi:P27 family predicted phage terminase small subunit